LDILINNAAHQEPYLTILESDPEVDWRTWEVNVHGLVNMTRSLLPLLLSSRDSKGGLCTIINVASSGALTARAGSSNYRSSKLAILRWTEILQLDHQAKGLLAYCVNPGAIKTRMTINESEEMRAKLPHKPDIAGDTITWLGAERKEWLAGRYISCPWDMEELVSKKDEIVQGDKLKMALTM
jgi:NAD(P)-dependent dehydrogenase (short-subunit alcohol dehydrogenase family)